MLLGVVFGSLLLGVRLWVEECWVVTALLALQ